MSEKMPLSEIRRILERGEWWDNVRDVSPDEPCPWMDELNDAIEAALDRLTEHEIAEKDGLIVRLPCKVGDTVYLLVDEKITAWEVTGIELRQFYESIALKRGRGGSMERSYVLLSLWGEIAFSTRAEAEAALKEREARHGRTTDKAQC